MTDQNTTEVATTDAKLPLMRRFSEERGLSSQDMYATLANTIFPSAKSATREQVHALLLVAQEHGLNPWTKEIYAFPGKGGSVVPIVGVDGWYKLVNGHPDCDGIEVNVEFSDGKPFAATCRIYRKSWKYPTEVTEYLSEVQRNTDPWRKQPVRMLRHRAICQCARIAFGFSGIYEPDEGARFAEAVPAEHQEAESAQLKQMRESIAQELKTVEVEVVSDDNPAAAMPDALFGDPEPDGIDPLDSE